MAISGIENTIRVTMGIRQLASTLRSISRAGGVPKARAVRTWSRVISSTITER